MTSLKEREEKLKKMNEELNQKRNIIKEELVRLSAPIFLTLPYRIKSKLTKNKT
jgi:hypothetical protein